MAKRAKIPVVEVEDDSPVAATGDAPAANLPDQPAAPRSSPQRSPQRKSGLEVFACTNILLPCLSCAEVEPQPQERPETAPDELHVPPSPPRANSPARENA